MRILYVDVDSLRPDHLGCYGYRRATSPTVDRLASDGIRFEECYASDAPCLPSRAAVATGRFGIHTGAVNHGGAAADPWTVPELRTFNRHPDALRLFEALRAAGLRTASISSFPHRHGAPWFTTGLHEWHDPGGSGDERADEVNAIALPWLEDHAAEDGWLLHLNYWDPHTSYRTPPEYGNPFAQEAGPEWLTQEILERHRAGYGPMSARDTSLHWFGWRSPLPWVPDDIAGLDEFRAWIDGYDTGIRYFDDHLSAVTGLLERHGVLDDTLVVISADHGENQGELNVYGDHQTADRATCRVPLVMRWPGKLAAGAVDRSLRYTVDLAATLVELAGGPVPASWDGRSFAGAIRPGAHGVGAPAVPGSALGRSRSSDPGPGSGSALAEPAAERDHLVLSQMAWSCQRSVRFDRWLLIRTYHDGLKEFPELMLFDVESDPHEVHDLAAERPEVVRRGLELLEAWHAQMMASSPHGVDPLEVVLAEGGPYHIRGELERYAERLRSTGREQHARALLERHGAGSRDRD